MAKKNTEKTVKAEAEAKKITRKEIKKPEPKKEIKTEAEIKAAKTKKEIEKVKNEITGKLKRHFGTTLEEASKQELFQACAYTLRDSIMEKWAQSRKDVRKEKAKRVYYLSIEFLMGRSLSNNLLNLSVTSVYKAAFEELGINIEEIFDEEPDAGLGNGGLGRLAACFLDSLATCDYPAYGCSIRYEYGLFKQKIVDGYQIEMPDPWLEEGNPWEIVKPEEQVEVSFDGNVVEYMEDDKLKFKLENQKTVIGMPYDVPIVGNNSKVVDVLRLWSAKSPKHMDLELFSEGDYLRATEEKQMAEVLSKVLYPEDNHYEGKRLRLRQQYFFVSCTVQWIVRNYKKRYDDIYKLHDKVVLHINDTHPALAIPEMMRVLIDQEGMGWDDAWSITSQMFAYTNHTVLSEALEKWPADMMKALIPRVYMILEEIDRRLRDRVLSVYPNDYGKADYMAVINNGYVSMANLCLATVYAVNGVSGLHTEILKNDVFADYYRMMPEKFNSITNGITFRRWVSDANPELAGLITESIGEGWLKDWSMLKSLEKFKDDGAFRERFADIKDKNKARLADYVMKTQGIELDTNSIFDVHAKRLHEYKRQLLNVLHILYLYNGLLESFDENFVPRTFIFAAKAAPGYARAKLIIKLINTIADKINNDLRIKNKIKVVFLENYNVSLAEILIPATNLSEQISTAGKEASGTGNMKFMANGALTIGTLDGANVEMTEQVGADNIFIFGMRADEVARAYRFETNESNNIYMSNREIKRVLDMLIDGSLDSHRPHMFEDLYHTLVFGDHGFADQYMVIRDFEEYAKAQRDASRQYLDSGLWNRKAILNVANSGYFSSDRTIEEYNSKIWRLEKLK